MISDSKRKANKKWDSENIKSVSCRVRRDIAEDFAAACHANGTNPNAVLHDCILQYLSENRDSSQPAPPSF